MKTYLFIDTETTGFKKSGNLIQEGQGRVCQLALILAKQNGQVLFEFSTLIKPNNWNLNGKTENYFGLPYADCEEYGMTQSRVMSMYFQIAYGVDSIVAHNSKFDKGMMDVEGAYFEGDETSYKALTMDKKWHCTMLENTHISANGKWPKLDATLQHFCNRSLGDEAHEAMADTRACKDIFFASRGVKL